jgi:hypothetical protein
MVETLERLQKDDAAELLSAAARALSPKPQPETIQGETESLRRVRELIEELRRQLHLRPDDNSPRAQAKIFQSLSQNLSSLLLRENEEQIRESLGQQGELSPQQYKIVFTREMEAFCEAFRLRKKQITEAMQHPDGVEHLLKEKVAAREAPAVSLYARQIGYPDNKDSFILLIHAIRSGDRQEVRAAFRVFRSDVDFASNASPLVILKSFVDVYGCSVRIGNVGPSKFILYEKKPFSAEANKQKSLEVNIDVEQGHSHMALGLVRPTSSNFLEVAVAYAIDTQRYAKDLESHGIDVSKHWRDQSFVSFIERGT